MISNNYYLKLDLIKKYKRCQACGNDKKLVVHHVSYLNIGHEPLKDVRLLCAFCHNFIHTIAKGRDPQIRYYTDEFIHGNLRWKKLKNIR